MIIHLLLALGLSAASIAILVKGLRVRPNTPAWGLFVILFFAIWAGGLWVAPAVTIVWLPFLLIAVLLTVLVAALSPRGRPGHQQELEVEREVEAGLGLFFFVLVGALIAAIAAGYR
jgi:hypothetical protein